MVVYPQVKEGGGDLVTHKILLKFCATPPRARRAPAFKSRGQIKQVFFVGVPGILILTGSVHLLDILFRFAHKIYSKGLQISSKAI